MVLLVYYIFFYMQTWTLNSPAAVLFAITIKYMLRLNSFEFKVLIMGCSFREYHMHRLYQRLYM